MDSDWLNAIFNMVKQEGKESDEAKVVKHSEFEVEKESDKDEMSKQDSGTAGNSDSGAMSITDGDKVHNPVFGGKKREKKNVEKEFKRCKPMDDDEVVAYIDKGYGDNFRVEEVRVRIDKNFEKLLSEAEITINGVKYPVCYVLDDGTVKIFDNELLEWIRYEYFGTLYLDKELTKRDVVITVHKLIEEKGVDTTKKGWMAELTDKVVGDEPDWERIWLIVPEELINEWEKLSTIGEKLGGFVSYYVCDVTVNGKPAKVYKVSLDEIETESTVGSPIGYYGSIEIDDNGRVVADDGWITGWLVKDIDVDILKRVASYIMDEKGEDESYGSDNRY